MRYWIYWNDLVQGPFELDELSTLKALSEDLPVCLEDRTDWLPACRIADLAPIIEERRSSRMPPPPPPPPPTGRPAADPLQGEFFTEAPNQKWLFPDNDPSKGPFALSPAQLEMKTVFPDVTFTAPIRFYGGGAAVATAPSTRSVLLMPERREEQEAMIPMAAEIFLSKASPVPELKEDIAESPSTPRIVLEIYPDTPEPAVEAAPSELPPLSMEPPSADRSTARIAAWVMGIFAALFLVGSLTFKWFDFSTSRAAINEAKKRMPGVKPLPVNAIAPVSSAPSPGVRREKAGMRAQLGPHPAPLATFASAEAVPSVQRRIGPMVSHLRREREKSTVPAKDAWQERQKDAIDAVMNKKIAKTSQTIGELAQAMVAQTQGQTKAIWDAIQIKGSLYRVSLVLSSSQPDAADAMHLYPFLVNLKTHRVSSEDAETSAKFLKAPRKTAPAQDAKNSAALPVAAVVPGPVAPAAGATSTESAESWKNHEQEAKDLVVNKIIKKINQTVGERVEIMADQAPGQAKALWNATQVKGALYAVSLVLGNRLYPFKVDLKNQVVSTEDAATSAQFLKAKKKLERSSKVPVPVVAVAPAGTTPVPSPVVLVPGMTPMANSQATQASASAPIPAQVQASENKVDPWKDRFKQAIDLATHMKIATTGQTVGERAIVMLEGMHDKELLYAADTGQRLYLPDKIAWSALQESGPLYRVYLGFSADQANGERTQTQSYQFQANLALHVVVTDDAATAADFLNATTALIHKRDPRAADIQNVLSGVDLLNKQLMRAIIVKDNRKNRLEEKDIAAAIKIAMQHFQRAVIYFRSNYPDAMLQKIAQAYSFTKLLKDHV